MRFILRVLIFPIIFISLVINKKKQKSGWRIKKSTFIKMKIEIDRHWHQNAFVSKVGSRKVHLQNIGYIFIGKIKNFLVMNMVLDSQKI